MDIKKIRQAYPGQWVLIEYEELDDALGVKRGVVLDHSSDKDHVLQALSKTYGKNVAVEYTGPIDSNLTVMFCLK